MEHYYDGIQGWFGFQKLYSDIVISLDNNSHIVEVGSWKGRSSVYMGVEILNSGKKIKFDCVDTWMGSIEHQSDSLLETPDGLYNMFINNIEPLKHIITPVRETSTNAAKLYSDESLDFVFIDAAHDYDSVKEDIESWYPKIKIGGFLAGHDYNHPPVKNAVDEVLKNVIYRHHELSWMYVK